MPRWGGKWGTKWGCPRPVNEYAALCRQIIWKQGDFWVNFRKVCEVFSESVQAADIEARRVEGRFGVGKAAGDELDQWGEAVDFRRFGAHDGLYRSALIAAGLTLIGSGRPADFHQVINAVRPGALSSLVEIFPACVRLFFVDATIQEIDIIFGLLQNVPGLGICLQRVETFGGKVFIWGHTDGDVPVPYHWDATLGGIPGSKSGLPDTAGWAVLVQ